MAGHTGFGEETSEVRTVRSKGKRGRSRQRPPIRNQCKALKGASAKGARAPAASLPVATDLDRVQSPEGVQNARRAKVKGIKRSLARLYGSFHKSIRGEIPIAPPKSAGGSFGIACRWSKASGARPDPQGGTDSTLKAQGPLKRDHPLPAGQNSKGHRTHQSRFVRGLPVFATASEAGIIEQKP
ncbi:MAG: hypothetical protein CVV27_09050 [Candidatus Melainabacteria bacterium HGW-Melainabacteria-1]|nr:MAG: hypothetical protein CVV27_09050 [Candidatus Melainabacteria bacterium HGW-Melainabacteria-1]